MQLEIKTMPSWHSLEAVEKGIVDDAFVSGDVLRESDVSHRRLYAEELLLVSSVVHPPIHSPEDIEDQSLLDTTPK